MTRPLKVEQRHFHLVTTLINYKDRCLLKVDGLWYQK